MPLGLPPRRWPTGSVDPLRVFIIAAIAFMAGLTSWLILASEVRSDVHERCDLALQLSFDVSSSMDNAEYAHMRDGTAAALLDPEVVKSFAERGVVWVSVVAWGERQQVMVDWTRVDGQAGVEALAGAVAAMQRPAGIGGMTATGNALLHAQGMFERGPACDRLVLDVATDGENNSGQPPVKTRAALDQSIMVNGIATTQEAATFLEAQVKQGPLAFVVVADGFERFGDAMKNKLTAELFLSSHNLQSRRRA